MLSTYGSFLPLRVLEEIRHWKQQESWHVEVIKSATEGLEPAYVRLLDDWRTVFEQTERTAIELLEEQRSALDPAEQAWQHQWKKSRLFLKHIHTSWMNHQHIQGDQTHQRLERNRCLNQA